MPQRIFLIVLIAMLLNIHAPLKAASPKKTSTHKVLTTQDLLSKINLLEKELKKLKDEVETLRTDQTIDQDSVKTLEASLPKLHLSGWLDTLFFDDSRKGTKSSFDQAHVYLIGDARIEDNLNAYAEIEFEHSPDLSAAGSQTGSVLVEQAWMDYKISDALIWRVGRFITPYGLIARTHWDPLTETVTLPLDFDQKLVPLAQTGVQLHGRKFFERMDLDYAAYFSNGKGNPDPADPTSNLDANNNKAMGFDLQASFNQHRSLLGISGMNGVNADTNRGERTTFIYGRQEWNKWNLQGQHASHRSNKNVSISWLQTSYKLSDKVKIVGRLETENNDPTFGPAFGKVGHNLTIGALHYQIRPNLLLKLELNKHRFNTPLQSDYSGFAASTSIVF